VNKSEFVELLAERTDLSKAAATRSLDGILDTLTEVMVDRDEVSFSGWGKFSAQRRKGREAHDPRNAQRTIHVPAAYVPKFRAGSVLRREIAAQSERGQPEAVASGRERNAPTPPRTDSHQGEPDGNGRAPGTWRPLAQRKN